MMKCQNGMGVHSNFSLYIAITITYPAFYAAFIALLTEPEDTIGENRKKFRRDVCNMHLFYALIDACK